MILKHKTNRKGYKIPAVIQFYDKTNNHADDFGYSKVFNEVILDLIEKDLVSSTSVMVDKITDNQKEQINKLIELSKHHNISIGLHIDFKNTDFLNEIKRQYSKFVKIFGFEPIHIDLHKFTYLENGYPILVEFCEKKQIPCKNLRNIGPITKLMTKEPTFDGTEHNLAEIKDWLKTLKDEEYAAIIFHPGKYDPECKSSLNFKRRAEDAKKVVELNKVLKEYNVKLMSYFDLIKDKK